MLLQVWDKIYRVEIPFGQLSDLDGVTGWVTADGEEWFKRIGKGGQYEWFTIRLGAMRDNVVDWAGTGRCSDYVNSTLRKKCEREGWSSVIHSPIPYRFSDFWPYKIDPFPIEDLVFPGLSERIAQACKELDKAVPLASKEAKGNENIIHTVNGLVALQALMEGKWIRTAEMTRWIALQGKRLWLMSNEGEKCLELDPSTDITLSKLISEGEFQVREPIQPPVKEIPKGKSFSEMVKDTSDLVWYAEYNGVEFLVVRSSESVYLEWPELEPGSLIPIELFTAECWYPKLSYFKEEFAKSPLNARRGRWTREQKFFKPKSS